MGGGLAFDEVGQLRHRLHFELRDAGFAAGFEMVLEGRGAVHGERGTDGDQFLDANLDGGSDCNDNDATVFPGAAEVCDDGVDNDCDELLDKDDEECAGCSCEASIVPSSSGRGQGLLICLLVAMMASLRRRRD